MRILVISQYYYPEQFKITDICEQLYKDGNDVTVITGLPNYPEGIIYNGYKDKKNTIEIINGVEVMRTAIIPRGRVFIKRFLNYYSYVINSKKAIKKLKEKYDIVFVFEISPVMQIYPALYYKQKTGTPVIVYCQDLWPEVLTIGGVKRNSIIYKYYWKVSQKLYSESDKIIITSPSFEDYLLKFNNITKEKIIYLPQHSYELCDSISLKKNDEFVNLLYTGNIGKVQNVDVMIEAMKYLKAYNIKMHIVGNGSEYDNCVRVISENNLQNMVIMYGWKKRDELIGFYEIADACIMSLSGATFIGTTIPSKLQDYMSIGRPILAGISGDACKVIDESLCGIYCEPDSAIEFANLIKRYMNNKFSIDKYGINARKYFEVHYKLSEFSKKLQQIMEKTI